jgi:hypothetical protein
MKKMRILNKFNGSKKLWAKKVTDQLLVAELIPVHIHKSLETLFISYLIDILLKYDLIINSN